MKYFSVECQDCGTITGYLTEDKIPACHHCGSKNVKRREK